MNFNGKILKQIREEKGVTQVQLCDATNLDQATYSKYERAIIKNPPAVKVKAIADYLDVPYESFFAELKENKPELTNSKLTIPSHIDVYVHVKFDWGLNQ